MSLKSLVLAIMAACTVAVAAAGGYMALHVRSNAPARAAIEHPIESAQPPAARPADTPPPPVQPQPSAPLSKTPKNDRVDRAGSERGTEIRPKSATTPSVRSGADAPIPAAPAPASLPVVAPPPNDPPPVATRTDPPPEPATSKPQFQELTVKEDAVIGIRLDLAISTEAAKVEDKVTARVARDVIVDGQTAIPVGARLEGTVTVVEHGGKFKNRARIGVRFETLVLADNTRVPLRTETIFRNGEPPTGEASSKIGASAVVGAILGAVIGGKKGAAIGGAAGAAGGTAAVAAGGVNEAVIPAGTVLTLRLTAPVTVVVEKDRGEP